MLRCLTRLAVFVALVLIFSTIQGSEASEWLNLGQFQLVSHNVIVGTSLSNKILGSSGAPGDYVRIAGSNVKADGKKADSATILTISDAVDYDFNRIVILEGGDGKVIAIDKTSDAVVAKTPPRPIAKYSSLQAVLNEAPEILFMVTSSGSSFYFKSLLNDKQRILGFDKSGAPLRTSLVKADSLAATFTMKGINS